MSANTFLKSFLRIFVPSEISASNTFRSSLKFQRMDETRVFSHSESEGFALWYSFYPNENAYSILVVFDNSKPEPYWEVRM